MSEFQRQAEEILACPICYNLPRRVPVHSCSFGHIVCQDCQPSITFCPLCRNTMMYATNTLVGNICLIADHRCKFSPLGCQIKLKLAEIELHEKQCPERTVECPFREVKTRVFIKFQQYAVWSRFILTKCLLLYVLFSVMITT